MQLKKYLLPTLKVALPLALGLYLVWFFFSNMTEEERAQIYQAFLRANYWWVLLSIIPAVLSHLSRAYRWKYTLKPLGYKPDFLNSFFAVMIGYLINLAVPRLGEVSRCGVENRYDKIPFDKLLGTVIAERVADLIILATITTSVIFIQYEHISEFLNSLLADNLGSISGTMVIVVLFGLFMLGLAGLYIVYRVEWHNKIFIGIQKVLKGIITGVLSIAKMKDKGKFIFHTFFIWFMYFLMFYVCFFALPETSRISFGAALTAFVLGGIAIVFTNGGIGAYPIAVQAVLMLYGIDKVSGGALGWIIWTAQTIMIVFLGAVAMLLIPIYNKRKNANAIISQS